jgi:hypothetical protein
VNNHPTGSRVAAGGSLRGESTGRLRIVQDPLRLLLFALTILTVSRVHQHYPLLMKARPALLLVIGTTAYAYLNPRYLTTTNVLKSWPMKLVTLLGVLACCSAVFGISLGRTASFILDNYIKVLVYAFLLAVAIRWASDLYTFVWAYVIGCAILAYFSLFVFGITKASNNDVARLAHLYTYDANDLGVIMIIGLPLTLLLMTCSQGIKRLMLLATLGGIAATIARSGSRGAFIGFVAVAAAAMLLANSVSAGRRVSILVGTFIALALGAPTGYWKQMSTVMSPKEDYNYSTRDGRKALAERGVGYMMQYPVFGLGMDNFSRAECTISPKLVELDRSGPIRCTAPHNSYVQAGSELGFPGLLAWIALVVGGVVCGFSLRRRLPRTWRRGTDAERFMYGATTYFPLAMIGFAVTAFFVSFAWMEPLYILSAFTTGLYTALRQHSVAHAGVPASGGLPASTAPPRGIPGWRVAWSAQRLADRSTIRHAEFRV